jgi:outer membrane protein TolC
MREMRVPSTLLGLGAALAALAASVPARATQPLETFIAGARTASFDAREASGTERQRRADADTAFSRLAPTFTARGVYTRNADEVAISPGPGAPPLVITPLNQLDAYLQLDVPIVDLASYHRYRAASAVADSAALQLGATTVDVSRSVARAYYNLHGHAALVRSAEESVKAAEANLRSVDDRRSAGAATDFDHERAAASVARTQQDLADAELAEALAARGLETLSGVTPTPAAPLPDDDLHGEAPLAEWLSLAGTTPQAKVSRKLDLAAEQNRKAASRAYLPTLAGVATGRATNATGFSGENFGYALQLVLAFRLDYATFAASDAQQAAVEIQKVRVARTLRQLEDAVFESHRRVETGIAKCRAARAQSTAAARAAALAADRYSAGVATQLDVTQAQREAFLADAARIQADAELAYARAALRLAAGLPATGLRPSNSGTSP